MSTPEMKLFNSNLWTAVSLGLITCEAAIQLWLARVRRVELNDFDPLVFDVLSQQRPSTKESS